MAAASTAPAPDLARGSWVWVPSPDKGDLWVLAEITSKQDKNCEVTFSNGKTSKVQTSVLIPANPPDLFDGIPDLTKLSFLNDPSLLWNLHQRFDKDEIYTFAGPVLVAINPCIRLPELYGAEVSDKYKGGATEAENKLDPHIFLVAANAFRAMEREGASQSLVISGESGAGKTESTKLAMSYFATLSGGTGIEEQVLESNPIMEAFGNAKTQRNHNSSRFGKLISIHFNHTHHICGATIDTYLLEKSRVTAHLPGERSYHIFYQLLAGLGPEEKERYHLPPCIDAASSGFRYLGDEADLPPEKDAEDFSEMKAAMLSCGITEADQQQLFAMLCGIMWLGNIEFEGGEAAAVSTPEPAEVAAELLGCNVEMLKQALTVRLIKIKGQADIVKPLNEEEARDLRDCMAKAVYECIFDWLVVRINNKLAAGRKASGLSISILDIFGFEQFEEENGFDQLLINYANERLQQQFCRHLMALEQEVYREEGLPWEEVAFEDNQPIVQLLDQPPGPSKGPLGILTLLDGQSKMPKGSDDGFLLTTKDVHEKHNAFKIEPRAPGTFNVNHFAGPVRYTVHGFLDRNRDTVPTDLVELLSKSSRALLKKEFGSRLQQELVKGKSSLALRFRQQMDKLMGTLEGTGLHFVRCIKPNPKLQPRVFRKDGILHQLKCAGILAVAKIYRDGMPTRYPIRDFVKRYNVLLRGLDQWKGPKAKETDIQACKRLLVLFAIPVDDYRIGKSKVFFRSGVLSKVEDQFARLQRVAVRVQVGWKQWRQHVWFSRAKKAIILMQCSWRGTRARRSLVRERAAVVALQGCVRCRAARRQLATLRSEQRTKQQERAKKEAEAIETIQKAQVRFKLLNAIDNVLSIHKSSRDIARKRTQGSSMAKPIPAAATPFADPQPSIKEEPVLPQEPLEPFGRTPSRPVNSRELDRALSSARETLEKTAVVSQPLPPTTSLVAPQSNGDSENELAMMRKQMAYLMQQIEELKRGQTNEVKTPKEPPSRLKSHNGSDSRNMDTGSSDSEDALQEASELMSMPPMQRSRLWSRRNDSLRLGGASPAQGKDFAMELYNWVNGLYDQRTDVDDAKDDLELILQMVTNFGKNASDMDDELAFLLRIENVVGSLNMAEAEMQNLHQKFHLWRKSFELNYQAAVSMLPQLAPPVPHSNGGGMAAAGWHPILREVEAELNARVLRWTSQFERELDGAVNMFRLWREKERQELQQIAKGAGSLTRRIAVESEITSLRATWSSGSSSNNEIISLRDAYGGTASTSSGRRSEGGSSGRRR